MGIQGGSAGHLVLFRRQQSLQLPVLVSQGRVSLIKGLRDPAPPNILGQDFLILRGCQAVFLLQCFQGADGANVVFVCSDQSVTLMPLPS